MFGKIVAIAGLALVLGGCTLFGQEDEPAVAVAAPAPAEPQEPAPVLPSPRPANLEESYAVLPPEPEPEPVEAETTVGMDFLDLRRLLGDPNEQQVRAPGEVWTYKGENCSLTVFFYPQVGEDGYRALIYEVEDQEAALSDGLSERERANACVTAIKGERSSGRSVV